MLNKLFFSGYSNPAFGVQGGFNADVGTGGFGQGFIGTALQIVLGLFAFSLLIQVNSFYIALNLNT